MDMRAGTEAELAMLISKQPASHNYKKATVERPDIPKVLERIRCFGTESSVLRQHHLRV
jgi:hypothetical protein